MVYYLLLKGDTKEDLISESNVLGEESFGKFYPSHGFEALHKIIHNDPESLTDSRVIILLVVEVASADFENHTLLLSPDVINEDHCRLGC